MKYGKELNEIQEIINKNQLQEAVEKLFSISRNDRKITLTIKNCLNIETGGILNKDYLSNAVDKLEGEIYDDFLDEIEDTPKEEIFKWLKCNLKTFEDYIDIDEKFEEKFGLSYHEYIDFEIVKEEIESEEELLTIIEELV